MEDHRRLKGLIAALTTPLLMGIAPILGKLAIRADVDPFTLAALRTGLAAVLLWVVFLIAFRKYTYIFTAGLLGTLAVGAVNGVGSLFYYNGLELLDNASLAQLLNTLYLIFAMMLTRFDGDRISRMSLLRAALAIVAVFLLTGGARGPVNGWGVAWMILSAFLYALHVVLSQRVMYEMPAPTMALYAMSSMALTVLIAWLVRGGIVGTVWEPVSVTGWEFVVALGVVTAFSRVTLFSGVRSLGGLQTILLNVAELAVTLVAALTFLGERMTLIQWGGAFVMVLSVVLSRWDSSDVPRRIPERIATIHFFGVNYASPLTPNPGPLGPSSFALLSRLYRRPRPEGQEPDVTATVLEEGIPQHTPRP
jgi:drug/metabolite transporter (DMT)-like permease